MQLPPLESFGDDGVAAVIAYLKAIAVPRWWVTLAGMGASTFVLAALGVGSRSRPASATESQGPQLPDDVRRVSVLGARYDLDAFTGTVLSEKSWTETTTTTTVTGGQWQASGSYAPWSQPGSVSVTTTTTRKDDIILRHRDGSASAWHFTNSDLIVAPGETVTFLARTTKAGSRDCLVACNRDTGQVTTFGFAGAHSIPGFVAWLAAVAVGAVGFVWGWQAAMQAFVAQALPGMPASPAGLYIWGVMAVCAGVIGMVPLVMAGTVIPALRTASFNRRYLPGIIAFLQLPVDGQAHA
jgi:hypothetical protein